MNDFSISDAKARARPVRKAESTERTCRYLLFRTFFDNGEVAFSDDSTNLIFDSQVCRLIVEVGVPCSNIKSPCYDRQATFAYCQ